MCVQSQSSAGGLGDLKEWTQAEIEHDKVTVSGGRGFAGHAVLAVRS